MEHLEEGEVHAWIDGEASAARGAEIELHAASCAECAARIAEARGFVAASSRILSALDDVPGDVIPAIPPARPDDLAVRRQAAATKRRFFIPMSAAAGLLIAVLGTVTWSRVGRERATETFAIQEAGNSEQGTGNKEQATVTAAAPIAAPVAAPIPPPRPSAPTVASAAPARDKAVAQSAAPKESRAELASVPPAAMAADEGTRLRSDRASGMAAAPMPSAAAPTASPMAGAAAAARGSAMGRREAAKASMADAAAERPTAVNDEATVAGCYRIDGSNPPRFLDLRATVLPEERDPAAHLLLLRGGAAAERAAWAFVGRDSVRLELGQTSMATTVRARAGRDALSGVTANGHPFRAVRSVSCD